MRKLFSVMLLLALASAAYGAASRSDSATLATDPTFQNRVKESLVAACINIASEAIAQSNLQLHIKRTSFCSAVVQAPDTYKTMFAGSVATDASVLADATANGTVALTSANVAAQAALVTDAHIDSAVSGQFNTYITLP